MDQALVGKLELCPEALAGCGVVIDLLNIEDIGWVLQPAGLIRPVVHVMLGIDKLLIDFPFTRCGFIENADLAYKFIGDHGRLIVKQGCLGVGPQIIPAVILGHLQTGHPGKIDAMMHVWMVNLFDQEFQTPLAMGLVIPIISLNMLDICLQDFF